MPLRPIDDEEIDIKLAPMIDVFMLLMIYFMVVSQFTKLQNKERQFEIKLPTAASAQPLTARPDEIVVNVDKVGKFYVGEEAVTPEQLQQRLEEAQKNYAEQEVMIRGDGGGNYQHIMDVLSICHQVKITNIKLANTAKSNTKPGATN